MISRRALGTGIAAVVALLTGLRFYKSEPSGAEDAVSPKLAKLADAWAEAARDDRRRTREIAQINPEMAERLFELFNSDAQGPEITRWRKTRRALAEATATVLREPSRNASDVILKYHVINMSFGFDVPDDAEWWAIESPLLLKRVDLEAKQYGVKFEEIFKADLPFIMPSIDRDPHSPAMRVVARWMNPYAEPRKKKPY